MKLTVLLGSSGEESFDINLYDNSFARKWAKEFQWCLENCEINQDEAFSGLLSLEESCKILMDSCLIINKYLKNFIEVRDNILDQPQDYFNYLHSKFEKLSGGFGSPTRIFSLANKELKDAIRNLNFYLHRVETKIPEVPYLYFSFNKDQYRRLSLDPQDYDFFEFDLPAGTLYLHYAELGKEFLDLYQDNLPIDYPGLQNLHYYSGEASLIFFPYSLLSDENYVQWMKDNSIDPCDKKLGHGRIPLGLVEDLEHSLQKIKNQKNIFKILIKE